MSKKIILDYDTLIYLIKTFGEFEFEFKNDEHKQGVKSCIRFIEYILAEVHKSENAEWELAKNK